MPKSKRTIGQLKAQLGRMRGYRDMLAKYKQGNKFAGISTGKPPTNPKMAWWALPLAARKLLDEQRNMGRFGGIPGQAPYWRIQDVGLPEVGIKGINYLSKSIAQWQSGLGVRIRQQLGGIQPNNR